MRFNTNGSEVVRIDSSGRVGIGTTTVGAKLHIEDAGADAAKLRIGFDSTRYYDIFRGSVTNGGLLNFYGSQTGFTGYVFGGVDGERARIDSSGRVGIGTTSPSSLLSVAGDMDLGTGNKIKTTSSGGTVQIQGGATFPGGHILLGGGSGNDDIRFGTSGASATLNERARIDANGRLLVGTASATFTTQLTEFSGDNSFYIHALKNETASDSDGSRYSYLAFIGTQSGGEQSILASVNAAHDGSSDDTKGTLVFRTNSGSEGGTIPTERMRIDSAGSVVLANASAFVAAYIYNTTTGSAANVNVDASGFLRRSTSSIKYKENVQDATHGLTELLQLRSVTYTGKSEADGATVFGGLIAEEVDAAGLSEFVQYAEDGSPDALAYGNMVSLCVKAIQEQQAVIEELQAKVAALEGN
jgi:hypothetical protein